MAGKGKFIYIYEEDGDKRIVVKDSAFNAPEDAKYFPLSQFSTDDLLKVKAQIATNLENRMDLDEVTESNLEKLRAQIRGAKAEAVAKLARQTLDRLDVIAADEKRAKTRLEIIQDELKYRMVTDEMSEMKFAGLLSVTYKPETVFAVGEDGWIPVYSNIVAESVANQLNDGDVVKSIADGLDLTDVSDEFISEVQDIIEEVATRAETDRMVHGEDTSKVEAAIKYITEGLNTLNVKFSKQEIVRQVTKNLINNVREGLLNPEAFAILQKRLTSTTLNDLVKQGLELPKGIEQATVRKVKTKRLK